MSVTFTIGATVKTIRSNAYPERSPHPPRQKIGYSEGGGIKVAILGDDDQLMHLEFRRLSSTDYTNLRDFIRNTANHSENAFTFTDTDAADHSNMRYISGLPEFEKRPPGVWFGTLTIRKDLTL